MSSPRLSRREFEIADLVREGLSNKEIARRLFISERTVEGHVQQINNKLGFNSRAQIAAWVAVAGMAARPPAVDPHPVAAEQRRSRPRRAVLLAAAVAAVLIAVVAAVVVLRPSTSGVKGAIGRQPPRLSRIAALSGLNAPTALAAGVDGSLYVADTGNNRVLKLARGGRVTTFAGGGALGFAGRPLATDVELHSPQGLALDDHGNLYVSDTGSNRVLVIDGQQRITVFAGNGVPGNGGDGGPAVAAELNAPTALAWLSHGGNNFLEVCDEGNNRVRLVFDDGGIEFALLQGHREDPPELRMTSRCGIASTYPNIYLSDPGHNRVLHIRAIDLDLDKRWEVRAGDGRPGYAGDGGPAASTSLDHPSGLALAKDGSLYIADAGNGRIRLVDASGTIHTVAGGGNRPDSADPLAIRLNSPQAVAVTSDHTLYIGDTGNNRVLKLIL